MIELAWNEKQHGIRISWALTEAPDVEKELAGSISASQLNTVIDEWVGGLGASLAQWELGSNEASLPPTRMKK